jgi:hypothetical protein
MCASDHFAGLESPDDFATGEASFEHNRQQPIDAKGRLMTADDVLAYALAGRARLTLVSEKTGVRFTFRISKPSKASNGPVSHFVALLTGPDNENAYTYMGNMRSSQAGVRFEHGRKSRIGTDSPGFKAFDWAWRAIVAGRLPAGLQVWHEGICGRCARPLTVPESVARGFGPECADKLGM